MEKKQAPAPVVVKKTTSKSTKLYWGVLVLGVALAVGGFFYKDKNGNLDSFVNEEADDNGGDLAVNNEGTDVSESGNVASGEKLSGMLLKSDNPTRGNLKLDSALGQIYLRTERDFSALVGANVSLVIEGTLENFRLVDVVKN